MDSESDDSMECEVDRCEDCGRPLNECSCNPYHSADSFDTF